MPAPWHPPFVQRETPDAGEGERASAGKRPAFVDRARMGVVPDEFSPGARDAISFAPVIASEATSSKLREDLLATWIAVTDAGGSVGFTAPADRVEVAAALDAALSRVAAGRDALGIVRSSDAIVGMGLLVDTGSAIQRHWRTLLRVMVRPELQGTGTGRLLVEGLHEMARDLGWSNSSSRFGAVRDSRASTSVSVTSWSGVIPAPCELAAETIATR